MAVRPSNKMQLGDKEGKTLRKYSQLCNIENVSIKYSKSHMQLKCQFLFTLMCKFLNQLETKLRCQKGSQLVFLVFWAQEPNKMLAYQMRNETKIQPALRSSENHKIRVNQFCTLAARFLCLMNELVDEVLNILVHRASGTRFFYFIQFYMELSGNHPPSLKR